MGGRGWEGVVDQDKQLAFAQGEAQPDHENINQSQRAVVTPHPHHLAPTFLCLATTLDALATAEVQRACL